MRTQRVFYPGKTTVYKCELEGCPSCQGPLRIGYTSGHKSVQTLSEVESIAQQTKQCVNGGCSAGRTVYGSVQWQQIAPKGCTYGYDVIAQIGWMRQIGQQTFGVIHRDLSAQLQISETQVRALYHYWYLPLWACYKRGQKDRLMEVAKQTGLIVSLDGLAPEGGEAQLWLARELTTGITLRSGWMSQQDQAAFEHFLEPIAALKLPVLAIMSDKQRGLVPAVAEVFPEAKHAFCQSHYLGNIAKPIAEADEAMKVSLRKDVRAQVGDLVCQEKVEAKGVMTVTGVLPSPVEAQPIAQSTTPEDIEKQRDAIVQDICRRIRYLLTLKGRPPFRLAGIEMVERLTEVHDCLTRLIAIHSTPQLIVLQQGLHTALHSVQPDYADLRLAADWLEHIADLLNPDTHPPRSGRQVQRDLLSYLDDIQPACHDNPRLSDVFQTIRRTTHSYASGLFHCYDVPGLPRTNNDRESDFRDLNRRLLRTTGQKALSRRIIQREGAWELLPRPATLQDTVQALSQVSLPDFLAERQRVRQHRSRFRLHTRSAKLAHHQLYRLQQRWAALVPNGP
jgi:hypothetical protein